MQGRLTSRQRTGKFRGTVTSLTLLCNSEWLSLLCAEYRIENLDVRKTSILRPTPGLILCGHNRSSVVESRLFGTPDRSCASALITVAFHTTAHAMAPECSEFDRRQHLDLLGTNLAGCLTDGFVLDGLRRRWRQSHFRSNIDRDCSIYFFIGFQ